MLAVAVVQSASLTDTLRSEILELCNVAYEEDLTELFGTFGPATHIVGRLGANLVSHAMWVTRWLQPGGASPIKTAYVEMVATHPDFQRRGLATGVMRRLVKEIPGTFELAALCTGTPDFYEPLGWRFWQGPLSIRMPSGKLMPTPDERVMVLPLPGRPALDLDVPLSAEWREGELW